MQPLSQGRNRGIYRPKHDRVTVLETQSHGARTSEGNQPPTIFGVKIVRKNYLCSVSPLLSPRISASVPE